LKSLTIFERLLEPRIYQIFIRKMADIRLVNVTKRFGDVVAVKNMNLEVKDKEFTVFLGPSGCGKTTTLRSVAGLERPEEGDIFIDDVRVNDLRPADRDIAFVFQFYALYPHLTAYDNIAFPLKAVKVPRDEIDKQVKEVANILHIEHLLKRKPGKLSGGEQQRVALGRAIVRQPKVFLMDEPLTSLDQKERVEMRAKLKRLQNDIGATTIYVTHDQIEAMSMGDRIAVMKKGVLQQVGAPDNVYHNPANLFVAGFMGNPPMNLLDCDIAKENGKACLKVPYTQLSIPLLDKQTKKVEENATSPELVLGIRAEDISLSKELRPEYYEASLFILEPLGSENIIDLNLGENPEAKLPIILKARSLPTFWASTGDKLWLGFDRSKMRIFDRKTEELLA